MDSFDVSRRAFVIGAATVAAAAPAVAGAADVRPGAPVVAPGIDATVPFAFDRIAFAALLDQPYAHRQVATATTFAEARDSLNFMRNSIEAYGDPHYFAAGPNAFHAVAVLYHGAAVLMGVSDAMFAKYPLATGIAQFAAGAKTGIEKTATANPAAAALGELVAKHNAKVFLCNNAVSGISVWIAQQMTPSGSVNTRERVVAVHDDLTQHLLPGVYLVPAGVAAINAAQEARFTLLPA